MLKRCLWLVVPLLLIACDPGSITAPPLALVSSTPSQTLRLTSIPATATLTASLIATITISLTGIFTCTPTGTSTRLPSASPTETPNLFSYVFLVQPPNLARFSTGGPPFPATVIFTRIGTNFVAVTSGIVDQVSYVDTWNPATNLASGDGSLSVRILGTDRLQYFGAYLSSIARGIRAGVGVPAGKRLGPVSDTGDARFTSSHVHFEVSLPAPSFTTLDAFPLRTAWLASQQIPPPLPTL